MKMVASVSSPVQLCMTGNASRIISCAYDHSPVGAAGYCQGYLLTYHREISQGEKTKLDRFVDPNVRGAQRRGYSDLQIYRN